MNLSIQNLPFAQPLVLEDTKFNTFNLPFTTQLDPHAATAHLIQIDIHLTLILSNPFYQSTTSPFHHLTILIMPGRIEIPDSILHPILEQAHNNKWTAQSVSDNIWTSHQIRISVRTIRRRIEAWGLKHRVEYDEETVKKAVLEKHGKSYNQKRTLISMKNQNKIVISQSTLACHEKRLQLNWKQDDLDLNKITYKELVQLIN